MAATLSGYGDVVSMFFVVVMIVVMGMMKVWHVGHGAYRKADRDILDGLLAEFSFIAGFELAAGSFIRFRGFLLDAHAHSQLHPTGAESTLYQAAGMNI